MMWLRDWIDLPAIALGLLGILILTLNRRVLLIMLLAGQYLLAAWLMLATAQFESAGAILLAGLLSVLMLFISVRFAHLDAQEQRETAFPSNILFRISVGILGVLASIGALRAQVIQFSALAPIYVLGGVFTLILGLMQLGLTRSPLRIAIGLLSTLTGFTVLYIAVEPSLAVVALLALVHLGISLTCSYVLLQFGSQELPEGQT